MYSRCNLAIARAEAMIYSDRVVFSASYIFAKSFGLSQNKYKILKTGAQFGIQQLLSFLSTLNAIAIVFFFFPLQVARFAKDGEASFWKTFFDLEFSGQQGVTSSDHWDDFYCFIEGWPALHTDREVASCQA